MRIYDVRAIPANSNFVQTLLGPNLSRNIKIKIFSDSFAVLNQINICQRLLINLLRKH